MIKLEAGKSYLTRDGRNTGPLIEDNVGDFLAPDISFNGEDPQVYSPDGSVWEELLGEENDTIVAKAHSVIPYTFTYRNWRGEVAERTVTPIRLEYAATDWHPEPQWLLIAWDNDKNAERSFAMKDINP